MCVVSMTMPLALPGEPALVGHVAVVTLAGKTTQKRVLWLILRRSVRKQAKSVVGSGGADGSEVAHQEPLLMRLSGDMRFAAYLLH